MNETDAMRDLMDKVAYAEARATLFERAFRLGPEATLIVRGADGAIIQLNLQAEVLFGYYGGELIGQPVEVLVAERLRAAHAQYREVYTKDPRTRLMGFPGAQLVGRKKDGTEVPILVSLTPFHTETGVLIIVAVRQQPEDASAV